MARRIVVDVSDNSCVAVCGRCPIGFRALTASPEKALEALWLHALESPHDKRVFESIRLQAVRHGLLVSDELERQLAMVATERRTAGRKAALV